MLFPVNLDYKEFRSTYQLQPANWQEAACDVCVKHNLVITSFTAYTEGSNLVAAVNDDLIIKIFPPFHRHQWLSEHTVLSYLQEKTSITIPKLIGFGILDDNWTYVIITKLPGEMLELIWPICKFEDKHHILSQIGSIMKEIHTVSIDKISDLPPAWDSFINTQLSQYKERHKRLGMPEWFLESVENYVNEALQHLSSPQDLVLLTGEYTPFNLLVEVNPANMKLTGMIDFGDAMIGNSEYDLIGPLLFLCEGNKELVKTLLISYGYNENELNNTLRKRLLLLAILHRYSNLKEQIRIVGWQDNVNNFNELEQIIWPL